MWAMPTISSRRRERSVEQRPAAMPRLDLGRAAAGANRARAARLSHPAPASRPLRARTRRQPHFHPRGQTARPPSVAFGLPYRNIRRVSRNSTAIARHPHLRTPPGVADASRRHLAGTARPEGEDGCTEERRAATIMKGLCARPRPFFPPGKVFQDDRRTAPCFLLLSARRASPRGGGRLGWQGGAR